MKITRHHINGLVQERCNSIANALELRISCINPAIWCPVDINFYFMVVWEIYMPGEILVYILNTPDTDAMPSGIVFFFFFFVLYHKRHYPVMELWGPYQYKDIVLLV